MAASVWLMSGLCTTLVAGVADCHFAQGLPWLIPVMPHEASHSSIDRLLPAQVSSVAALKNFLPVYELSELCGRTRHGQGHAPDQEGVLLL